MIETQVAYKNFEKKIIPYLDGSLAAEELAEFEAFILTHPEFELKVQKKREEIDLLKTLIPMAVLSPESREALESEMKSSIQNLLIERHQTFFEKLKSKWVGF